MFFSFLFFIFLWKGAGDIDDHGVLHDWGFLESSGP